MADELTSTGLAIDSFDTRLANVQAALRAAIAPNLDLSPQSATGQLVYILVERIQANLELIRAIYSAWDPDSATGQSLTALAYITGTARNPATPGHVTLTVNLNGGVTLPAGSVAAVTGEPTNRWVTDDDVVAPAGPAANYFIDATAETAGAIQALLGTITVIATPVAGWNSVTNAADATPGDDEETDVALRLRRELELAIGGSTSVDAIQAELIDLDGMEECWVLENATDVVDANGLPAHSFEAILWDGSTPAVTNALIAETIFKTKAAGIRSFGVTTQSHTDDQGNAHAINFTRADDQRMLVEVTLTTGAGYPGAAAVRALIEAQGNANLGIGDDVYRSKVSAVVCTLPGVVDCSLVRLSIWPAALGAADVPIGLRQIARFAAADVTVI
jgi:uncharacterized phage protein gp47/JayE